MQFRFNINKELIRDPTIGGSGGMAQSPAPQLVSAPKAHDWNFFHYQLQNYLIINAWQEARLPLLLSLLGHDGIDIYGRLPEPKDTYETAIAHFTDYLMRSSPAFSFDARNSMNPDRT